MRILSRYFVTGYLTFYAGIVIVSMLVIAIVEMMVNLDHVFEYGEGFSGAASYLFLKLPTSYLGYVIPAGSLGAAFLCLGFPARSLEVLAAKASGISPPRLALPVIAAAGVLSGLSLVLNETIVLDAANRFNLVESGGVGDLFHSDGEFWESRGPTLLAVEAVDREAGRLDGVRVYERDERGRLVRSVTADAAKIEPDGRWRLENAHFRAFAPDDPTAIPTDIEQDEALIDLGMLGDLKLLGADPRALSLWHLGAYVAAVRAEGGQGSRYRSLWHARVAEPLSVLMFAVLGAPLGIAVERSRSLATAALEAVAWLGAYYGLRAAGGLFGTAGATLGVLAPWALLALFGGLGVWRLSRAGRAS